MFATMFLLVSGFGAIFGIMGLIRVRAVGAIRLWHINRFFALNKRYIDAFFESERAKIRGGQMVDLSPKMRHFEFDDYVIGYDKLFWNWRIWTPQAALLADYEQDMLAEILKL